VSIDTHQSNNRLSQIRHSLSKIPPNHGKRSTHQMFPVFHRDEHYHCDHRRLATVAEVTVAKATGTWQQWSSVVLKAAIQDDNKVAHQTHTTQSTRLDTVSTHANGTHHSVKLTRLKAHDLTQCLHTPTAPITLSQWSSGNMPDCGVRGPRFKSHRGRLYLSRQPLWYTALGTGCTPLLQCLGRLSLPPSDWL